MKCFPHTTPARRTLTTPQSAAILDLCLRKTRGGGGGGGEGGNSHDYSDSIVFEKLMIVLVHNEMQSQRFQIPSVGRMFSESAVFVTD